MNETPHTATPPADRPETRLPEATRRLVDDRVIASTYRMDAPAAAGGASPLVALALSMVLEGLGQAYNRQPLKAVTFAAAGIGLSTASGLNTWLARHVLGLREIQIGPARPRPDLIALWGAVYALNVLDAWRSAARGATRGTG